MSELHQWSKVTSCPFCLFIPIPLLPLKGSSYFLDHSNGSDWLSAILSLLFVVPLMLNVESTFHWQAGAVAGLHCWMGFLLYLQRCLPPWYTLKNLQRASGMLTSLMLPCLFMRVFSGLRVLAFMLWCLWKSWGRCSGSCCSSSTWCLHSVWLSTLLCWTR